MPETRTATVKLAQGTSFLATSGSGHTITIDNSRDHGGQDLGPTPMELLLLGLAGCTGMDVIAMLRKARQDVTDYEVHAEGERAETHPRVYTHIVVTHVVRGRNLNPRIIAHSVELSATRYCPASATLGAVARIEEVVRVIDEVTGAVSEERIQHAGGQPTPSPSGRRLG
jgi:putative redox protein